MIIPTIFQIEDDEDFSFLMEYAIKEIDKGIGLTISPNGIDGIALLNSYREQKETPRMILLDINLPGISGIEILKVIREMPELDEVPVIMFSTSDNPKDIKMAFEFGANEFKTKPLGYRELVNSLKLLCDRYLTL